MGVEPYAAGKENFMNHLEAFKQHRPLLFSIAYRMLGSVTDAEDLIQETFLRWQQASKTEVRSPKAYLSRIITRLCIDYLRSARLQREQYVGSWLPEPIITQQTREPAEQVELADSLSIAFLVLLESLSPTERAVFLLREIFDYDYPEVGRIVDKSPTNCRQTMRRARQRLASRRPRFAVSRQQQERLTRQFMEACSKGDLQGLLALLAEDITFWSDGGGKVTAALKPLHGSMKVARFLIAIRRSEILPTPASSLAEINGQPGIINYVNGYPESVVTFEIIENCIQSIYTVRNQRNSRVWANIHQCKAF